ncbi:MAG: M48 family metallopeptidase [Burkholderiales bacterium]
MPGRPALPFLLSYPDELRQQVQALIDAGRLGEWLARRYPEAHVVRSDGALYDYAQALKARHLRSAPPLAKVSYVARLDVVQQALGTHTAISRVQGGKLKAKREIRVASLFRDAPAAFLQMIVVHELAHLKEPAHDKAFYSLCCHMTRDYHQLELDTRVWLTHRALSGGAASPADDLSTGTA